MATLQKIANEENSERLGKAASPACWKKWGRKWNLQQAAQAV
jgi:hypothetical protein